MNLRSKISSLFIFFQDNLIFQGPGQNSGWILCILLVDWHCEILLVSQIGPGAQKKLLNKGIKPIIMPVFIEDALEKVYSLM
jgi:predicted Fe-Mo cluster-binding NifX family protein